MVDLLEVYPLLTSVQRSIWQLLIDHSVILEQWLIGSIEVVLQTGFSKFSVVAGRSRTISF